MKRRDFVRAGLAVGGLAVIDPTMDWSCSVLPPVPIPVDSILDHPPSESGIDTVVVVMMENRSFDSYLGWLARDEQYLEAGRQRYGSNFSVDGQSFQTFPAPDGTLVDTYRRIEYPDADPWRACGHPDPGHGWTSGRAQRDGGFLAPGSNNDLFALGYFEGEDLPVYDALARRFMVCDRWYASCLGPTYPNREYLLSGTSGGNKSNAFPTGDGFPWPTIVDRLAPAGVTVADYYTDLPPLALWGSRMTPYLRPIARYYDDCAAGQLPSVTFVDPGFIGDNRTDDHPHGDPRAAQQFVRDVFAAFVRSPQWERGLFVLTYDEWGGFFDHVGPPLLADDRINTTDNNEDFRQAGFRVPTILCSPKVRPGAVDHTWYDHTSVLRFLEWRFLGAPARGHRASPNAWWLTQRDRFANNPGDLLDVGTNDPDPGFDPDVVVPAPSPACGAGGLSLRAMGEDSPFEVALDAGYFERVGVSPGS